MKKLLLLLFCMILLVGTVSAGTIFTEFDNVKSYDENTKTATIKNLFGLGKTYAEVQLKSPLRVKVPAGYQKVAEFETRGFADYKDFIKTIKFYDRENDMKEFEREFDLKYKTIIEVPINDYQNVLTGHLANGSAIYENQIAGTHLEQKEEWIKLTPADLKKNENLTIGIFTNVKIGDSVEWVPNFAGVKVPEWAWWIASFDVGNVASFEMERTSGDVEDKANGFNGTNSGTYRGVAGKIGNAFNYTKGESDYVNLSQINFQLNETDIWTIDFWVNSTDGVAVETWFWDFYNEDGGNARVGYYNGELRFEVGGADIKFKTHFVPNTYYYVSARVNGTGANGFSRLMMNNGANNNDTGWVHRNGLNYFNLDTGLTVGATGNHAGGFHNGQIDMFRIWNRSLNDSEETWQYNSDAGMEYQGANPDASPTVTSISPANQSELYTTNVNLTCYGSDDINFISMKLYVDGVLNQTNSSGMNNTNYTFNAVLPDDVWNWSCQGEDNASQTTDSVLWVLTVNTSATISVQSPNNATMNYSSANIYFNATANLTVDVWIINYNGTNYTLPSINSIVSVEDGLHYLEFWGQNIESDVWGMNDSIAFDVDTTPPSQTFNLPIANTTTDVLPVNVTLNVTVADLHLDTCLYWTSQNATNTTYTCNTNQNVSFSSEGAYTIYHCVNDTFGFNTCGNLAGFEIFYYTSNADANPTETGEGNTVKFVAYVNMTDIPETSAVLDFNNTNYSDAIKTEFDNYTKFVKSVSIPDNWGNTTGTFVNSQWFFNISGVVNDSTAIDKITIHGVSFDDCSVLGTPILNYTIYDEESKVFIIEPSEKFIEVYLILESYDNSSLTWNYSAIKNPTNTTEVCIPTGMLTGSSYKLNSDVRYSGLDYVVEFNFIDSYNLSSASEQNISLFPLNSSDSTSFLIEYQDENYLPVQNAIINLWRFYVGDGQYLSVENGRTDDNGQTVLHFVTEEIQYKTVVSVDGEIVYTSPDFLALCQEVPCQINLQKQDDVSSIINLETVDNLAYSFAFNDTTRNVTLTYATRDGSSSLVFLNVTKWDARLNATICTKSATSSGGTLTCNVPETATNTTYLIELRENGEFVAQSSFNLKPNAFENFGYTGIILVGLLFLTLVLMAVPSGAVATLVFGALGLMFAGMLTLFNGGSIIGVGSAMMWLIIAIVIIIIKISSRTRHS